MSVDGVPPWMREQFIKLQQTHQNLNSIMLQKENLEIERFGIERTIEELQKIADADNVYRNTRHAMVKTTKDGALSALQEENMMSKTRSEVLVKQERRLQESIKEQEAKITSMVRTKQPASPSSQPAPPEDNSRR